MAEDALIRMVEIPMGSRNTYEFDPPAAGDRRGPGALPRAGAGVVSR